MLNNLTKFCGSVLLCALSATTIVTTPSFPANKGKNQNQNQNQTCNDYQPEDFEYFISGFNTKTGERVVGWLTAKQNEPTVRGVVLDRTGRWRVVGKFSGKGLFTLVSQDTKYEVEVVPEISGDRKLNAKIAGIKIKPKNKQTGVENEQKKN